MAILKLQNGKENAITGTVANVTLDSSGNFGPQYKVELTTGDCIYVNKDPFERQANRLQKLPNELSGEVVTLWKKADTSDPTGKKGFFNLDLGNTSVNKLTQAVMAEDYVGRDLRNAGVPVKATTYEEIVEKYQRSLASAVSITADATESLDLPFTSADITAIAATLFIEANKRGA